MRRWTIVFMLIGSLCFAAAGGWWWWRSTLPLAEASAPTASAPSAASALPEANAAVSEGVDASRDRDRHPAPESAPPACPLAHAHGALDVTLADWQRPLRWTDPEKPEAFETLAGRKRGEQVRVEPATVVGFVVPPLPDHGRIAVLVAGTVGGVQAGRLSRYRWRAEGADRVRFQGEDGPAITCRREQGVWRCDADKERAFLDAARMVAGMRRAFAVERTLAVQMEWSLAGLDLRPLRAEGRRVLLALARPIGQGPISDDGHYPRNDWDDLLLEIGPEGAWRSLARLQASAGRTDDPGWLVRRMRLEFDDTP